MSFNWLFVFLYSTGLQCLASLVYSCKGQPLHIEGDGFFLVLALVSTLMSLYDPLQRIGSLPVCCVAGLCFCTWKTRVITSFHPLVYT